MASARTEAAVSAPGAVLLDKWSLLSEGGSRKETAIFFSGYRMVMGMGLHIGGIMHEWARHSFVALTILFWGGGIAWGQSPKGDFRPIGSNDRGLSTRELVRSATQLADALRSSDLVMNSPDSIQVASPAYTRQLANRVSSIQMLGHLLNEINMRCGAKIQFIRRDSKDPEGLPASSRFDYESRILVIGGDSGSEGRSRGGLLLMELYEPAGESPAFVKSVRLGEGEGRREDSRDGEQVAESAGDRNNPGLDAKTKSDRRNVSASAIDLSDNINDSARHRSEDDSMVRKVPFGRVEFREEKVARRLAVLSVTTQWLSDGRIQVQMVMVSRKNSQDVDILTTFVDGRGQKLAKPKKEDYEFEEGQPRTVVVRSRKPAEGFVMRIEND